MAIRHKVIQNGDYYTIEIYKDDELLIVQPINPLTGDPITNDDIENVVNYLLSQFKVNDTTVLENKLKELKEKTYLYIKNLYPDSERDADITKKEFWTVFLVVKGNYTFEDVTKTVYKLAADIADKKISINDIPSIVGNKVHSYSVNPIRKTVTKNYDSTISIEPFLIPSRVEIAIDYASNTIILRDDGLGKLIDDKNDQYGTIDYESGIITFLDEKFDRKLMNSVTIKYNTAILIPEYVAFTELVLIALKVASIFHITVIYDYLKNYLRTIDSYELSQFDIDKLISEYYPKKLLG